MPTSLPSQGPPCRRTAHMPSSTEWLAISGWTSDTWPSPCIREFVPNECGLWLEYRLQAVFWPEDRLKAVLQQGEPDPVKVRVSDVAAAPGSLRCSARLVGLA